MQINNIGILQTIISHKRATRAPRKISSTATCCNLYLRYE